MEAGGASAALGVTISFPARAAAEVPGSGSAEPRAPQPPARAARAITVVSALDEMVSQPRASNAARAGGGIFAAVRALRALLSGGGLGRGGAVEAGVTLCLSTALTRHRLRLFLCTRCHRTALFLKRSLLFCMLVRKVQYWKLKVDNR